MTFLTPWFLLGGLAVTVPLVLHLIRRTTRDRTPFGSLMFLFPTPPRLTKRSRLEHLLLLCLRCLVLCLLALGFARPLFKHDVNTPPSAEERRILLLVDSSASMRRANLWSAAREKVQSVLAQANPSDHVALFTFDRKITPLLSFAEWDAASASQRGALAASKLAQTAPGWASTRLDTALIQAAEAVGDLAVKGASSRGEIVLISDLQEGSHLEQLQGYEWPNNVRVTIEPLTARQTGNASLQVIAESEAAKASPDRVRLRVSNTADSKHEQFRIGWASPDQDRFVGSGLDAYVPPGQSRVFTLPAAPGGAATTRLLLQGDQEDFDNVAFTLPLEQTRLTVLYCGGDQADDPKQPLYFLQRAFQETRRQAVRVQVHNAGTPVAQSEIKDAALVVVSQELSQESAHSLRAAAEQGKTLLVVIRDESMASTLGLLAGANPVPTQEAHPNNYALLADIDFRHPLFAPFADARFADFTKIHFWKFRRVNAASLPDARVLARFDSGDPALLELAAGKGRVFILTSGWQPEDSQLALSTKFVPLLYSVLEASGARFAAPAVYRVGDSIPLTSSAGLRLIKPDGAEVPLTGTQTNFFDTLTPGVYTFVSPGSTQRFAVNLDPSESRTSPLSVDEFERLGVPLSKQSPRLTAAAVEKSQLQNAELENRQKLWRWLLLSALGVLLLETWLGGRAARRVTPVAEAAVPTTRTEGVYQ